MIFIFAKQKCMPVFWIYNVWLLFNSFGFFYSNELYQKCIIILLKFQIKWYLNKNKKISHFIIIYRRNKTISMKIMNDILAKVCENTNKRVKWSKLLNFHINFIETSYHYLYCLLLYIYYMFHFCDANENDAKKCSSHVNNIIYVNNISVNDILYKRNNARKQKIIARKTQ